MHALHGSHENMKYRVRCRMYLACMRAFEGALLPKVHYFNREYISQKYLKATASAADPDFRGGFVSRSFCGVLAVASVVVGVGSYTYRSSCSGDGSSSSSSSSRRGSSTRWQ